MATSIIPKSEARINNNLIVGYGELPAVEVDGKPGWGLPDGKVVFCEKVAREVAELLDREIRSAMKHPSQLLVH